MGLKIKDLKENEGIICNSPQEREAIRKMLYNSIGWPAKDLFEDHDQIIFYPYETEWDDISEKDNSNCIHYQAKLFLNNNNYELWEY